MTWLNSLFPCAKIVLDRFHIIQHLSRAMSRFRVQINESV
ncbi:transposase [Streptococcus pneumoniae GA19077]|nr:transposase [Streptococcus pneumoniae GA19077]